MSYILYPFAWLLLALYNVFKSYGMALILFSLIIKLVLLYFSMQSKKGTMKTARLQPKMKELEKRYAGNKTKYNEELQKLYKDNDVKMMGGCVWSLIPFPILIGLYSVIRQPLTYLMHLSKAQIETVSGVLTGLGYSATSGAYNEITMAQQIYKSFDAVKEAVPQVIRVDFSFLGLDLAAIPQWKIWELPFTWAVLGLFLIPVISALLSFLSTKISMMGGAAPDQGNMKSMMLMAPLMSIWIGFIMPAGLGIYWIATSVFTIIQDYFLAKYYNVILDKEDAVRIGKMQALEEDRERKRLEYERLKAENSTTRNVNTSKKKVQKVERLESEKKELDFEKKTLVEKGNDKPVDEKRPFSRGRAFNPERYVSTEVPMTKEETAKKANLSAEEAEAEAARKDEEDFEKFLATGKIAEDNANVESDSAGDETMSDGEDSNAKDKE